MLSLNKGPKTIEGESEDELVQNTLTNESLNDKSKQLPTFKVNKNIS